jgi:Helix-turn-helix domain
LATSDSLTAGRIFVDDLVTRPERVRDLAPAVRASLLAALLMAAWEPAGHPISADTDIGIITTAKLAEKWDMPESTIRDWCRPGKIPAKKIDKVWLIPTSALKDWLPKGPGGEVSTMLTSAHDTRPNPQTPEANGPFTVVVRQAPGRARSDRVEMGKRRSGPEQPREDTF